VFLIRREEFGIEITMGRAPVCFCLARFCVTARSRGIHFGENIVNVLLAMGMNLRAVANDYLW